MLILSRKHGESIVIDGGITVTVNAIRGNVVQLGIVAPKEISIHRSEIRHKIRDSVPDFPVSQD
jgi:carbon storage regulator